MVSEMAENLIGSEIIRIAGEINDKIKKGEKVNNMTIGDFDPQVFPIPEELTNFIIEAYKEGHTNYPAANGIIELRKAISSFILETQGLKYTPEEILVSGGARPLIYAIYRTLIDEGDKVIFPVPSWNNNHYCHLSGAEPIFLETNENNNFMPTAEDIKPYLEEATLITLCSPLNPTGTVFKKEDLMEICELVLKENKRRKVLNLGIKPLYVMYDQIYWKLTFGQTEHFDPISINPELRDYVIYVDGISKAFAATGVRVGWIFGPQDVIGKLTEIFSHIGAWAPKPEQNAVAEFLSEDLFTHLLHTEFNRGEFMYYSSSICDKFEELKERGYRVDCQRPEGGIYVSVYFDYSKSFNSSEEFVYHLINNYGLGIVPFEFFGSKENKGWFRISIGNVDDDNINNILDIIENSVIKLHQYVNSMVF